MSEIALTPLVTEDPPIGFKHFRARFVPASLPKKGVCSYFAIFCLAFQAILALPRRTKPGKAPRQAQNPQVEQKTVLAEKENRARENLRVLRLGFFIWDVQLDLCVSSLRRTKMGVPRACLRARGALKKFSF